MVGLPAAGKKTWVESYCRENLAKKYNVLGTNSLIDKMKVNGLPRRRNYAGRWDALIDRCTKCLNKLLELAYKRRRNFIVDQVSTYFDNLVFWARVWPSGLLAWQASAVLNDGSVADHSVVVSTH